MEPKFNPTSCSSDFMFPQPLEALHGTPIPAFLSKTFDLVEEPSLDPIISWGSTGQSFVVWDPTSFATSILPHNFKHNNLSSFVRQLNTYGFRKVDSDRLEFAHEDFLRGKRHYLKNIHRRRPTQGQHTVSTTGSTSGDATQIELEGEIEQLKKDKTLLMQELVKLQQEHRRRMYQVEAMKQRLVTTEQMQKNVISFLAKLLRNPVFFSRLRNMSKQKEGTPQRMKRNFVKHSQAEDNDDSPHEEHNVEYNLDVLNIQSAMETFIPIVDGHHSDNLLQDMVEKIGHGMNDMQSQVRTMPADAVEEELVQAPNNIEIGGSSLGSLEYEGAFVKENDAVSHQFQACSDSLLSYQEDLLKDSTLSGSVSPKVDCVVKHEDGWNVDFNVSSDIDTSRQDFWMNLTNYDDQELGLVGGLSNLWGWESQEAIIDVGVDTCMGEESSLEHFSTQAKLP